MSKAEVEKLLEKYRKGLCTEEERALVESWHLSELSRQVSNLDHAELLNAKHHIWSSIASETGLKSRKHYSLFSKIAAAAMVLFFISFVIYFQLSKKFSTAPEISKVVEKTINPGGNKATLTLLIRHVNGTKFLTISGGGFIAYYLGVSQYQILSINANEMWLRCLDKSNAGNAWYLLHYDKLS